MSTAAARLPTSPTIEIAFGVSRDSIRKSRTDPGSRRSGGVLTGLRFCRPAPQGAGAPGTRGTGMEGPFGTQSGESQRNRGRERCRHQAEEAVEPEMVAGRDHHVSEQEGVATEEDLEGAGADEQGE